MSLEISKHGPLMRLTLDRPAKKNALSLEMVTGLRDALQAAERDEDCRCIVLSGAGGTFCAGRDLGQGAPDDPLDWYFGWDGAYGEMLTALLQSTRPVVAVVEGHAVAGGFTIAMCCHFVIARDNVRFGALEMRNGFPAAVNTAVLADLLPRRQSLALLLSQDTVGTAELDRLGLINQVIAEGEDFAGAVDAFAQKLCALDARAARMTLELHAMVKDMPLTTGVRVGKQMNALLAAAGKMTRQR